MPTTSDDTWKMISMPGRIRAVGLAVAYFLLSVLFAGWSNPRAQVPPRHGARPGNPTQPRAEEIVKKALERAKWDDDQKIDARYTYTQRSTTDELDSKGNVKKHEERLFYVLPIDGKPYSRLIEKDGKPLSEKDTRLEREHERKFRQRLADRKRRKEQGDEDEEDININEELVSKYRFTLSGRETLNGRAAYILSFEPRSGALPIKRRLDRLLNKVAGRVWIDEQDYAISRVDLHLAENVSAWGGLLASVRKFLLHVEQIKVDETAWLPSYVDAYFDGRILIKSLHMKLKQQNSDFRKITPEGGSPAALKR